VPVRRPEFELSFVGGAEPCEIVVPARIEIDSRNGLRVAPVQTLGQSHHGGQLLDHALQLGRQGTEPFVCVLRRRLPMVAGDERNDLDFARLEATEVAMLDQVVGMAVMTLVTDVHANIVQQRAVLE
jgi:hypothetical protein